MSACLSQAELRRYTAGALTAEELLQADAHVAGCATCRARLLDAPHLARAVTSLRDQLRWNPRTEFNCLEDEQTAAYVEGTLDAVDREIAECHLELCSQCQEDVRSLREYRALMSTYPRTVYAPDPRPSLWAGWAGRLQTLFAPSRAYAWGLAGTWLVMVAFLVPQLWMTARLRGQLRELSRMRGELHSLEQKVLTRQTGEAREPPRVAQSVATARRDLQKVAAQLQGLPRTLQGMERNLVRVSDRLQRQESVLAALRHAAVGRSGPVAVPVSSTERSLVALRDGGGSVAVRLALPPGVSLPPDLARATGQLLKTGEVSPREPVRLAMAQLSSEVVRSGEEEAPVPRSPVRTFVLSPRPTFRWQPVPGATGHVVSLFAGQPPRRLWQAAASAPDHLAFPAGRPALRPGHTYLWRVEARLGEQRVLSGVARFRVFPEPRRQEVLRLSRHYARFYTVLAALYQQEGLFDNAEEALRELLRLNPGSEPARRLLERLQQRRQEPTPQ